MPIRPAAALSRLGLRLRERRRADGGGEPAITTEDRANIAGFEVVLASTLELLRTENEALVAGDIAAVADLFERKARLLKTLELRQPTVEPFLKDRTVEIDGLRTLIRDLAGQLQINGRLLKGMAEASQTILSEVERARSRQSLRGVYDKSGQLRSDLERNPGHVKKTL